MNRFLTTAVALSLCLTGCTKKGKDYLPKNQELRLSIHGEPPTLDPRKATDTVSLSVLKMCFEGLMRTDPSGEPTLAMAEKVTLSPDQKQYIFILKEAYWSNGSPVTAYDFEKTWKTELDPAFPCEAVNDLYIIKNAKAAKRQLCSLDEVGVKALDERTLQIDLDHPVPYFLSAVTGIPFLAVPSQAGKTDSRFPSNGPFLIKEHRVHDRISLVKNPTYWDKDNVKLEKVDLLLIEDEATQLSLFENGDLDWAGEPFASLPIDAIPTLKQKEGFQNYQIAGTYYYVFNTKELPFTNANIRKAFALAIHRQPIVSNITQAGQTPAMSLVPPALWKKERSFFKDHDVAEAKRLFALGLKELGITAEEFPKITLTYNTLSAHHKIAQAIQEQWHETLGVQVQLENKEWKVFLDELRHHKFQIARMGGLANFKDPITFLDFYRYLSSTGNHSQWTNVKFSELLEEADKTTDTQQRTALLESAEKIFMEEMPIAPIYFYRGSYLKKNYVKGIVVNELNDPDLKWAYVDTNTQVPR